MACQFCVTGQIGFVRDLSAAEIIGQVMVVKQHLRKKRITNIVFMGWGNPSTTAQNILKTSRSCRNRQGSIFLAAESRYPRSAFSMVSV